MNHSAGKSATELSLVVKFKVPESAHYQRSFPRWRFQTNTEKRNRISASGIPQCGIFFAEVEWRTFWTECQYSGWRSDSWRMICFNGMNQAKLKKLKLFDRADWFMSTAFRLSCQLGITWCSRSFMFMVSFHFLFQMFPVHWHDFVVDELLTDGAVSFLFLLF